MQIDPATTAHVSVETESAEVATASDRRSEPGGTPTATGSDRFRPDIEGLRAVAVLAVVAFHAKLPFFTGGFVGVDVFFVISGFLITGQMLRDTQRSTGFSFATFYARRVRRLLPIATIVILVTLAGSLEFHSPVYQESVGHDARAAALFHSNYRFADQATDYFQVRNPPSPYLQFWSLSVEEQYYFLWPALFSLVLLGAASTLRARRTRLTAFLVTVVVVSFAYCVVLTSSSQQSAFFWLSARAWELAIGALLAVLAGRCAQIPHRARGAMGWLGMAAIAAAIVAYDRSTAFPGAAAAVPVFGAALVIAAGTGAKSSIGSILSLGPFQAGGRYSYSLYLWHWPVLVLAADRFPTVATRWPRALVFVIVVAVPLTLASYHFVEHPVRRSAWLGKRSGVTLAMGAILILTSVVGTFAYQAVATTGDLDAGRLSTTTEALVGPDMPVGEFVPSNAEPTLRVAVSDRTATEPGGCDPGASCVYGDPDSETSIVVFGDSHTAHWGAALDKIARDRGWRIRRISTGACPSFLYRSTGTPTVDCGDWRREAIETIGAEDPDLIVLSNHSTPAHRRDPESWEAGVRDAIHQLADVSPVTVLSETPEAREDVPACLAVHLEEAAACEPKPPADMLDDFNHDLREVVEGEGASFVDTTPWFCTEDRCPVVTANIIVYSDPHHMTREFAASRADALAAAVEAELA